MIHTDGSPTISSAPSRLCNIKKWRKRPGAGQLKALSLERKPLLLDLFSGAGGAAAGYANCFDVVGVDIYPQPRFPYDFIQADALDVLRRLLQGEVVTTASGRAITLDGVAAFHASPPCQAYSNTQRIQCNIHPELVDPTRVLLEQTNRPWVIENVVGAPLRDPITLCGAMFHDECRQYGTYRHRLFEANFPLTAPEHPAHSWPQTKMGRKPEPGSFMHVVGNFSCAACGREAMGIDWMTRNELAEAIQPAYTKYVGQFLIEEVYRGDRIAA